MFRAQLEKLSAVQFEFVKNDKGHQPFYLFLRKEEGLLGSFTTERVILRRNPSKIPMFGDIPPTFVFRHVPGYTIDNEGFDLLQVQGKIVEVQQKKHKLMQIQASP